MAPRSATTERRALIREAAIRAIDERGFDAVRYSDVADGAGVAVGTVQYYFASRDALLGAAFLETNRAAIANARRIAAEAGDDPWDRLEALVAELAGATWAVWLDFWAAARLHAELRAVLEAAYEAWRGPVVEAIEDGLRSGVFASPFTASELAAALVAMVDGLGLQRELGLPWLQPARARQLVLGMLSLALGRALVVVRPRPGESLGAPPGPAPASPSDGRRSRSLQPRQPVTPFQGRTPSVLSRRFVRDIGRGW